MFDATLKAYLAAVAASATAMDLIFLTWAGAFVTIEDPGDVLWLLVFWLFTVILTLVGSFVPAVAMVGLSRRLQIRSILFFVGWSGAASLGAACIATWLVWSPDVPADDPDYLSFAHAFYRMAMLFGCGGLFGGVTYWLMDGRHPNSGNDNRE
jgi:hypothetical protein